MLSFNLSGRRGEWTLEAAASLGGGCVGLFGPSGSGKSTLLHMLAGLYPPASGRIELGGRVLFDAAAGTNLPPHRRAIGVVFQEDRLFPHYSVEGNLRYGEQLRARSARRIEFSTVVELFRLAPLLRRSPAQLSGGERRRVALGRALLASPELLLLDEPLVGLDAGLKSQILSFLQRIRDELAVPMIHVSHDLGEVLQLTRLLWIMDGGRMRGAGAYADLALDPAVLPHVLPQGLVNVLRMRVDRHDPESGCTRYAAASAGGAASAPTAGLELSGPLISAAPGDEVSLSIRAEDIAVASAPVERISVRNQIEGTVRRHTDWEGRSIVEIDAGLPLLVELSTGSFRRLGLASGARAWCLIKATGIRVQGSGVSGMD